MPACHLPNPELVPHGPRAAQEDLAPTSQPWSPSPLARVLPSLPNSAFTPVCPWRCGLTSCPQSTLDLGRPVPRSPLAPGYLPRVTTHLLIPRRQPPFAWKSKSGAQGVLEDPSSSSSSSSLSQPLPCTTAGLGTLQLRGGRLSPGPESEPTGGTLRESKARHRAEKAEAA